MNREYTRTIQYWLQTACLAVVYALTAKVVLAFFAANHVTSLIWPPSGIAMAALLLGGRRYWPGIFVGAVAGNLLSGAAQPAWVALLIGCGNTLEALVGSCLLHRFHTITSDLENPQDYTCLALAGALSAVISAACGVGCLYAVGYIADSDVPANLIHWWQGDVLGIILVTPFIMVWRRPPPWQHVSRQQLVRMLACFGLAFLAGQTIFLGWFTGKPAGLAQGYWMFLFAGWAAIRFGRHGVLLVIVMTAVQALAGLLRESNGTDPRLIADALNNLWFFLLALTAMGVSDALINNAREKGQERLRESEERWKFALEGSGDGVWDWNIPTETVLVSRNWQAMYGIDVDSVHASPESWGQFVHPDDMEAVQQRIQDHWEDRASYYHSEHRVRCSDGSYKWVLDRGLVVRRDSNGEPLRMVGTHSDITARKRAEEELRELNANLEQRVATRTIELEKAKQLAEAATQAKTEFLANMSHEIRTPISSVLGMAHLVMATELSAKQRDYIEKIRLSGKHLLGLVDNILDFSRIEAGKLALDESMFNLDVVLDTVRMMFAEQAAEKGITLQIDIDPDLEREWYGDPLRIGQILINYVNNAIKFSDKGDVQIRVFTIARTGRDCLLRFEVQDQGIGISQEKQQQLFRSFQQADSSVRRKYGGTGLGLAISRQLAELMGGNVGAESRGGQGSLFWFTVRLSRQAQDNAPAVGGILQQDAERKAPVSLAGARILLVEDNTFNQQVTSELLTMAGARVSIADNGQEAIDKMQQEQFDCILMDLQMPVMDGLQATRIARANPATANTLIIAMTANAWHEDRENCLSAGMDDFLAKPVQPAQLVRVLHYWLVSRSAPAIDLAVMHGLFQGDSAKVREVLGRFIHYSREDLAHLAAAIDASDLPAIHALGHKLKSGAAQIGASGFAGHCAMLEELQAGEGLLKARIHLRQLEKLLEQIAQQPELNR